MQDNHHLYYTDTVAKKQKFQLGYNTFYHLAFLPLTTRLNWTISDTRASIFLGLAFIYLAVKEPLLVVVILSLALFFYCLNRVIALIPYLNHFVQKKIHFWHIVGVIMALTMTLTIFEMPAQAIFLSGLEKFLTNIAQQSSSGGTSSIDPQAITLVFNAIRGVFLLLVGVAALFAYNQAQQGNDWRPIATQAGLAIGIILTIDVITFLFIGNGTTGNTGG
ncbi:hypothetical protein [Tolypothrix sp. PCC 7910]|uniref:hypothetical protein n=1 Tax=Tolypothrix sp. PCC 7910 TaxID=2099387 RepID=UPI001FCA9988|nr:hypothetical protein [Tolypothrix sp. PCC 7910]